MPYADRSKRLAYYKRWKQKNRQQYLMVVKATKAKRVEEHLAYIASIRAESACIKCGEDTDCCLDFHHRDPAKKYLVIGKMVRHGYSLERIKAEIAKCDILCSNCHRKEHAGLVSAVAR